jgi:hypothetical protein
MKRETGVEPPRKLRLSGERRAPRVRCSRGLGNGGPTRAAPNVATANASINAMASANTRIFRCLTACGLAARGYQPLRLLLAGIFCSSLIRSYAPLVANPARGPRILCVLRS